MVEKQAYRGANALLAQLPPDQQRRLEEHTSRVTLKEGKVIALAEHEITHVYFPVSAVLSILSVTSDKVGIESAVVGYEGMAPLAPFHNVGSTPEQIIVQVPGDALVIPRERFHQAVADAPALRERLHRYSQALFTFAAQSSACNRQHTVVQRCARWLLSTHDRVPEDGFYLTHQFLSQMLGVRRSSVTVAAEVLRTAGAIQYTRGRVEVIDREILARRGCQCYAIIRSTYDRLLYDAATPSPLAGARLADGDVSLLKAPDASRRITPSDDVSVVEPEESLAEFSQRLRDTRERTENIRSVAQGAGGADSVQLLHLADELSVALEELHVAEEEMRAQMESLTESRHALETQQLVWHQRFNGLPDAFIETDHADTIVEVNRAAEQLLGKPRARVIGKPITTLFPNTERRAVREAIHRLRSGQPTAELSAAVIGVRDARPQVDVSVALTQGAPGALDSSLQPRPFGGARWLLRRARMAG